MERVPGDYFRFERKFLISNIDRNCVESMVLMHPAFFREIFYQRYVNNIYFDYLTFNNFMDNIDGLAARTKYRIRWYGEMQGLINNPKLEIKVKRDLIGYKNAYDLPLLNINSLTNINLLRETIDASMIDERIKFLLKEQIPVMLNRYRRKYFATSDNKFRITIDDHQSFYKFSALTNYFLENRYDYGHIILELKYDKEYDSLASSITNHFPFRLTKSSKYTHGINLLYA